MKRLPLLIVLFSIVSVQASLILVKEGKPAACLVIAKTPTLDAQFAARELQYHIRLITGAELPILKDQVPMTGHVRILVGDSSLARQKGYRSESYPGEEYELRFLGKDIILSGSEVKNYSRLNCQHFQGVPRTFVPNHGMLWAAYDFLEKCCDVRWYGPGDIGIAYMPRKTLTVSPKNIRRAPFMECVRSVHLPRNIVTKSCYGKKHPVSAAELGIWTLRWRMATRYGRSNHNVYPLYYAYWRESSNPKLAAQKPFRGHRPEYFARGYEGKKGMNIGIEQDFPPQNNDLPPQPCMTNPEVIDFFAEAALADYQGKPLVGSVNTCPPLKGSPFYYPIQENDNHAYCKCPACTRAFSEKGPLQQSYLRFAWVNAIARKVKAMNPKLGISTLAYGCAQEYPHDLDLADNLAVQLVLHCSNYFLPAYRQREMKIFDDWTADSVSGKRLITLWTHYLAPCWDAKMVEKYNDYFPVFSYPWLGKFFQLCAKRNVRGWSGESSLEMGYALPSCQLDIYVSIRLADDPTLDPDQLVDEFFDRFYGHAADPVRRFHQIIAEAGWNLKNYPKEYADMKFFNKRKLRHNFHPETVNWGLLGTAERMKQLADCMREAHDRAVTPMEKIRMDILDQGLWQSMLRGRKAYELRERFKKRPTPELLIPRIPEAHGKVNLVDWANAVSTGKLKLINGFPTRLTGTLSLAHDGHFLYLRYEDEFDRRTPKSSENLWTGDGLDMFFAGQRGKPYLQFAVNPQGKTFGQAYFLTADASSTETWNFNEQMLTGNKSDQWILTLAFPLAKLSPPELGNRRMFYANFYRFVPGELSRAWSPTFTGSHHEFSRFGKLILEK